MKLKLLKYLYGSDKDKKRRRNPAEPPSAATTGALVSVAIDEATAATVDGSEDA